jgi:hypothetical protein
MRRGARGSHPGAPARLGRRHGQDREPAVRRGPGRCPLASAGEKKEEQGTVADRRDRFSIVRKKRRCHGLCWAAVLGRPAG